MKNLQINGIIIQGLRSASGLNGHGGNGTIAKQKPFFELAGVKRVGSWYNGTINVDISPKEFKILKPDHIVTCEWLPNITETFWLVNVELKHNNKFYPSYIYYPCPSEVKAHPDTTIEIITEHIQSLNYGDEVTIIIEDGSIEI